MQRRRPSVTEEDVLHRLEAESRRQTEGVRAMLLEEGRPDLVEDLDRRLRESRMGITGARATWDALTELQRKVLLILLEGNRRLVRQKHSKHFFDAIGEPHAVARVAGLPTIRNLIARELLTPDGGTFDPEAAAVLTERARFVVQHGRRGTNLE
ncbi:hypothetical protein GAY33_19150 [Azospirillum brasilense]|uniref:hypothetical protein n=1 Tax=Azospirillum argentinense TaxID=2970906 RepID=UPI00190E7DDE|nr:hypothetical protein [Azospirillum argentinense]MBK3801308.1 hypothetical protein [Azospirillum argentinense]